MTRPSAEDIAAWFRGYVARVPDGDVVAHLRLQADRTAAVLAGVDEVRAAHRYADGKWPVRRVWQHVVDGERMFTYRALCIARGETQPLPGFDENAYAENDGSDARSFADVAAEYAAVRAATVALFAGLPGAAWQRRGTANGNPFTVRGLAWITAGHELHHLAVLRERYGVG